MAEPRADSEAFHRMMAQAARFGATAAGGVHRLAASAEDGQARDWLKAWLGAQGFRTLVDPVGNLFGIAELAGPDAPLLLSGSHLDSQPLGGRFDGAYGVIAACHAALAIKRAVASGAGRPTHNLGVVSWTNEEGARFQPSLLGSSVYAGLTPLATALAIRDGEGVALGDALAAIGYAGSDPAPRAAGYVELHVECGPNLDAARQPLGVMTGWWGATKLKVSCLGAQAHTGPTAMARRRDALFAAGLLIAAIRELADSVNRDGPERLYTSVGRLEVEPNSPNVVPGRATLFVELRSPEADILERAEASLMQRMEEAAARAGVAVRLDSRTPRAAGAFDAGLIALAEAMGERRGHRLMRLSTVAGHDAIPLSTLCPSVVIVTPSVGGLCHHEGEYTAPQDLEEGLALLTAMLWRLSGAEGGHDKR